MDSVLTLRLLSAADRAASTLPVLCEEEEEVGALPLPPPPPPAASHPSAVMTEGSSA